MHVVELYWNLVWLISYDAFYLSFVKSFSLFMSLYYGDQLVYVMIVDAKVYWGD